MEKCVKKQNSKAAEADDVPYELLKNGGEGMIDD